MSDRIAFEDRPGSGRGSGVQIRINGLEFVDLVRAVETPFAVADGTPTIAGAYAGLPPSAVRPPSRHFLGEPSSEIYGRAGRIQILECECGLPGCWPLLCRIEVGESRVVWSDFEQPHRTGRHGKAPWTYEKLGPFVFDRGQYDAALETP